MNEFIRSLIHDKSVKRRLFILSALNNGEMLVSATDLATDLNCSIRTISNDISQLKKELPPGWGILGIRTKGYILFKPLTDSIHPIINSYLKNSITNKIMLGIFNNKNYSLEKWSQLLYTNKLSLKRNLKEHCILLQKIDLKINFRELNLTGNELSIRHYYHMFFIIILF